EVKRSASLRKATETPYVARAGHRGPTWAERVGTLTTGGFDIEMEHPFEDLLRRNFGLTPVQLERLALFMLAFGMMDWALTFVLAVDEAKAVTAERRDQQLEQIFARLRD